MKKKEGAKGVGGEGAQRRVGGDGHTVDKEKEVEGDNRCII